MAGIPNEIVERVKAETNIVDVVSDYVRLRRSGKNWTGLCPFHDDKKPSFAVEPVKGIYRCFSCGKGGNVFTFLMELNGWTFPETVRSLAASLGIEIPEDGRDSQQYSENEKLATIVKEAARFYYVNLKSDAGVAAQAYFKGRGFTDETIKRFGLGYSLDEWDAVIKHLGERGYTQQEMERAGLVLKREGRSGWYDRFRGRTMFPIFTATGRVVGFGARRMTEDPNQPKYLNSPETPIYSKSKLLYGLFQAKDAIRKGGRALFVEGYADVISLHQAGVQTAIATCGTAMTSEHAELISRYCSRVVLVFDSDRAGQTATERGIDVLLKQGLDISVLRLPDGEDPDTFVRKFGAKEFDRRVEESVSFLDFLARTLKSSGDLDAPDRKAGAIRSIVSTLALIPDQLKRELYLQKLAADYFLPEALMMTELEQAVGRQNQSMRRRNLLAGRERGAGSGEQGAGSGERGAGSGEQGAGSGEQGAGREEGGGRSEGETQVAPVATADVDAGSGEGDVPSFDAPPIGDEDMGMPAGEESTAIALRAAVTRDQLPSAEVGLLSVMVQGDPQMLEHIFARIDPEDFSHPVARELVGIILGHYLNHRGFAIDELIMEELAPEVRDLVTMLAVERESISGWWGKTDPNLSEPNPWKIARDCLIRIELQKIEHEANVVRQKMKEPDLDDEHVMQLIRQIKELGDKQNELTTLLNGAPT